ncbi:TonB-dependent receptor plug domain-containing protein [Roseateles koreensis]|uniref:TonB-dependent receptor n=1 Tax=Roseateles koreensis TaxID=2987526 RepID=A0ABT5KVQ6_9BURK|nr:TonB-dependent receptor [Roseateles koreensis]MDC8786871.1 TonB-dependent receptor [Roseateles koreensis]
MIKKIHPGFPLQALMSACLLACLTTQASAQSAADVPATDKLERVMVTGSNLHRIAAETPSPVQVMTATDLKQSGYTSVADVLHNITANNMGSLSQGNASAFAAGGSGVSLRGLTVGATLVLIDGHRMASYPMPDDGERDFVDIASIPFETIERIEILKDGASAVYGSDAMAGVVNVILKKEFKGLTLSGETGVSSKGDGNTHHFSITGGVGDLGNDGYNAYASLEYRQQEAVLLKNRSYLAITDWSKYGGTANIFDSNQTPNLAGNDQLQLQPKTQNLNVMSRFTKVLADGWQANLQASMLNSRATQIGVFNDVSAGQQSFAFGPSNSQNPTPNPLGNPYTFMQADGVTPFTSALNALGPQTQHSDTTSYRFVAELSGELAGWSVDLSMGHTRVETKLESSNFLSVSGFQSALSDGSFVPGQSTISSALRSRIAPTGNSTSTNELNFISVRGSRDLMTLAGGPLSLGTGLDLTRRKLSESFPAGFVSGDQYSPIYSFAQGEQTITAAYAELAAPITKELELDAAARVDHYDTYGNSVTPKFGVKYTPSKQLTLRGTYSQGFRAPNPAEIGKAGSTSGVLNPLYDPVLCTNGNPATAIDPNQCSIFITELQLSNPKLKPEHSDSYTLGLIFEPTDWFNMSLDYYDITIKDQIIAVGLLGQTQLNNPATYSANIFRAAPDPTIPGATVGPITYETYPFLNASRTHTTGVDIDLRTRFDLGESGKLHAEFNFTRMLSYDMTYGGTTYNFVGTHGPSFVSGDTGTAQDRAQFTLTWLRGPMTLTGTVNYISGMTVLDPTASPNTCDFALSGTFPNGVPAQAQNFCHVPSFTTFNLTGKYDVSKNFSVHASVTNLFDRHAPYDLQTFGSTGNGAQAGGAAYNPALHQEGAIGRFFNVGASYRF